MGGARVSWTMMAFVESATPVPLYSTRTRFSLGTKRIS